MGRVLINVARAGILPEGDTMDISRADVGCGARCDRAQPRYGHRRQSAAFVQRRGRERPRSRAARAGHGHAVQPSGDGPCRARPSSPMAKILELLKPGDVVTHLYAPEPNSIFDGNGRLFPEVQAARRRGIWFDFGNGQNGHVTWDVAERAVRQGFLPDTLSTDYNANSRSTGVIDLPNVMSKFLLLGVPLDQVVAMVTSNAAKVFPAFRDRGTLAVGAQRGRCRARAPRRHVRVPRQLRGQAHRQSASVPDRDRDRRQARAAARRRLPVNREQAPDRDRACFQAGAAGIGRRGSRVLVFDCPGVAEGDRHRGRALRSSRGRTPAGDRSAAQTGGRRQHRAHTARAR